MARRWRDQLAVVGMRVLRHVPRRVFWQATRVVYPTFTVGVVCVLLNERLEMLLVQNPYSRGWTVPGGFVGRGEQPRAAAARELEEELGLSRVELADVGVGLRDRRRQIDFVFLGKLDPSTAGSAASTSPEIAELQWFPLDELPPLHRDATGFLGRLRQELVEPRRFDGCLPPEDLEILRRWAAASA